ncbi:MAG: alkaline phosphatase family protein [Chitinophagaceae bacterium]|nr:alkaline phosphatase family protein [Chitinophagaceae bacterium]MCW5905997.1 alkaline phosphatase family protein [Chitinophagaceae bacterium]
MYQYFFKRFIVCVSIFLSSLSIHAQDTTQYKIDGRKNAPSQYNKPYIILISADGFRYDLAEKYNATFLKKMSNEGIKATSMKPSFPSLTFPNHYSIVTGLYPAHHGIVDNTFYSKERQQVYRIGNRKAVSDASWYGGVPIWALAENNQLMSASFYWVGSEANIQGVHPSYYFNYNEVIPIDRRISIVKEWLQLPDSIRPHLITFYFPEVDHAEHKYGVDAKETEQAVQFIDESMSKLYNACMQTNLPINFIFLSDHGMANMDIENPIKISVKADTAQFKMTYGNTTVHYYAKDEQYIEPLYNELQKEAKDYRVFLKKDIPAEWHYGVEDDWYNRIGDIVLTPIAPPKGFSFNNRKPPMGAHGFDNSLPEMQATFYAWGPLFKEKYTLQNFENVHVYPLIANMLGLPITHKIDGKLEVLEKILK